jgi:hypothetical protein
MQFNITPYDGQDKLLGTMVKIAEMRKISVSAVRPSTAVRSSSLGRARPLD